MPGRYEERHRELRGESERAGAEYRDADGPAGQVLKAGAALADFEWSTGPLVDELVEAVREHATLLETRRAEAEFPSLMVYPWQAFERMTNALAALDEASDGH